MNFDTTDPNNAQPSREAVDIEDGTQTLSEHDTDEGKISDTESCKLGLADIGKLKTMVTRTSKNPRGKRTSGVSDLRSPPISPEETVITHSRVYCLLIYNTFCCEISFFCLTFSGLWSERLRQCLRTTFSHAPS